MTVSETPLPETAFYVVEQQGPICKKGSNTAVPGFVPAWPDPASVKFMQKCSDGMCFIQVNKNHKSFINMLTCKKQFIPLES
jgi:hypothetical protein